MKKGHCSLLKRLSCLIAMLPLSGAALAQDSPATLFGGDVIMPSPGGLNILRGYSADRTPVVIYFQNYDWPSITQCEIGDLFDRLNEAGISVVILNWYNRKLSDSVEELDRFLETLRRRARWFRLDLNRIAVIGCGAGAHFSTLVASDPGYLERAGFSFSNLKAAAIVQGTSFDLEHIADEAQRSGDSRRTRWARTYFGDNPETIRLLSPIAHIAQPNAPTFLFVEPSATGASQAPSLDFARHIAADANVQIHLVSELSPRPGEAALHPSRETRERVNEEVSMTLAQFLVAHLISQEITPQ